MGLVSASVDTGVALRGGGTAGAGLVSATVATIEVSRGMVGDVRSIGIASRETVGVTGVEDEFGGRDCQDSPTLGGNDTASSKDWLLDLFCHTLRQVLAYHGGIWRVPLICT